MKNKSIKNEETSFISIHRLVDKGMVVINAFYSTFIVRLLDDAGHPLEFTLLVILLFILWLYLDPLIRKFLNSMQSLDQNTQWKEVLFALMDNIALISIFVFVQIVLSHLSDPIASVGLSIPEKLVTLFVIFLGGLGGGGGVLALGLPAGILFLSFLIYFDVYTKGFPTGGGAI